MRERDVINLWQHLIRSGRRLTTADNEPIKIIYPGRINHNRGADFCDAVVATKQGILKGDIEVHLKSSDWCAHRHHQNPTYRRVILHVVKQPPQAETNSPHESSILTLLLDKCLADDPQCRQIHSENSMVCTRGRRSCHVITRFLDSAGDKRFGAKADRVGTSIRQVGADQALYQELMGALGYSQNQLPFWGLAQRLPLRTLESLAQYGISDEEYLAQQQARLLGTAGLLPSQRRLENYELDERWISTLERLWASLPLTEAMPATAWNLFRVRPNNFPVRRLIAMSHLILRYRETGLLAGMVNTIKQAPLRPSYHQLAASLVVTVRGYWASHFDFGAPSRRASPSLLGQNRAEDIVVNVLLPFAFAWSQCYSDTELARKSRELYRHHPRLTSNSIELHMMAQLGLNRSLVNSARRQQGLLHIYHTRCTQGRCDTCPLAAAA